MQYCIYLRKSRADAEAELRGESETLVRHENILLELAKKLRLNITHIHREVVSGESIAARPVMQQLLHEVGTGLWTGVLVMEVERLARGDTIDQGLMAQTFKYSDTKIITPVKTYDPNNEFDEEYFEFGLFMSRREYKTINRRLQQGRLASVKEGKFVGNRPPYGYVRKKLEHDKGFTLVPHKEQADIVRMIFKWYTTGKVQEDGSLKRIGMQRIANELNKLNVPTQTGSRWSLQSIRTILGNPTHIGKIRWNWRPGVKKMTNGKVAKSRPRSKNVLIFDGLHEAIIDEDTFDLAQEQISKNKPRPIGFLSTVKNPLAGIVYCGKCGLTMKRKPYKNRNIADTLLCTTPHCDNVSSSLHLVEKSILEALGDWITEYKTKYNIDDKSKQTSLVDIQQKGIRKIDKDIDDLKKQQDNLHNLLEQGIYTTDVFLERAKIIADRLKQAEIDKSTLTADLELELLREDSRQNIIPQVEKLLEVYNKLSSAGDKNDMLKLVLEKVVYTRDKGGRWRDSSNFEILLYPKLPKQK